MREKATFSDVHLRRSILAVPASSEKMVEKAMALKVDHVFLDLEDAVAPDAKSHARQALSSLHRDKFSAPLLSIRINAIDTPWFHDDLELLKSGVGSWVDSVILPKVHTAHDITNFSQHLSKIEQALNREIGSIAIDAQIESAKGLVNCEEIASSEHPTFGTFDPNTNTISVAYKDRHIMDVLRTLAHELTHHKQREENRIKPDSGETGSAIENEANAQAGVLMRDFADQNAELFSTSLTESIHSGTHKVNNVTFDITQHAIDRMEERNIPVTTAKEMLRRIAASYSMFADLPKHEPVWVHDVGLGISLGIRPLSSGKLNWGTTILGEPQNRDARYRVIDI
jgi:hypothetical protein